MELENKDGSQQAGSRVEPNSPIINAEATKSDNEKSAERELQSFKLYEHGITNGLLSISPEMFEQFISYYYEELHRDNRIGETKQDLVTLFETWKLAREKRILLKTEELTKRADHGALILEANEIESRIIFWKEKIKRAIANVTELKERVKTDYTLFAAIIFFLFALLFIGADFGIALNIVADTLKIGTVNVGKHVEKTYIAYMFAMAIAGLAVVFKPAYDRLVEKPYQNAGKKKRFAWFIIFTSVSVLAMLFSLGIFREQVISSGMMDSVSHNTDIGAQTQMVPVTDTNFKNSISAKIGIISSTFLFAIAGAICLGISIPVLYRDYRITWNNLRQKFWNKNIFKLEKEKLGIESKRIKTEQEVKILEEKLQDLQVDLDSKELINDKKLLLEVLKTSKMQKLIAKSKAIYEDGYVRGSKLSGKITEEWVNDSILSNNQYTNTVSKEHKVLSGSGSNQGNSLSRTRPFVAIRRMISQNFKNKVNKDGNINFEYYEMDK